MQFAFGLYFVCDWTIVILVFKHVHLQLTMRILTKPKYFLTLTPIEINLRKIFLSVAHIHELEWQGRSRFK